MNNIQKLEINKIDDNNIGVIINKNDVIDSGTYAAMFHAYHTEDSWVHIINSVNEELKWSVDIADLEVNGQQYTDPSEAVIELNSFIGNYSASAKDSVYDDTAIKADIAKKADKTYVDTQDAKKQDKLTAGTNVTILGSTISAKDTVYDDTAIKADIAKKADKVDTYTKTEVDNKIDEAITGGEVDLSNYYDKSTTDSKLSSKADKSELENKQDKLVAGNNVAISGSTISATNTTYDEISEAEINTGTSSTGRTITARRVTFVLGKVGTMISNALSALAKSDVGLGNVDNTSDANKPISIATQSALDLKSNITSPAFIGTPTAPTATKGNNTTQIATTAFVQEAMVDGGFGDMMKSVYDSNNSGVVDNAEKVNGHTVESNVPSGAVFTDTITTVNGKTGAITKADITALGIPAQDTTYSTGTLEQLNAGSNTTGMLQTAKLLNDWLNAKGYITSYTDTTYTAGNGLTLSGTTFSLPITVSGSGTYVQSVTQTANGLTITLGTPPNTDTTYSEISEAEINTGTSSTARTITARRITYVLGKVTTMINSAIGALTKSDVGLSNVDNVQQASKTNFDNHTANSDIHITSGERSMWNAKLDTSKIVVVTELPTSPDSDTFYFIEE